MHASNLLYVPTNRRCTELIADLAAEAALIADSGRSCCLAVVEHAYAPWATEHRAALARAPRTVGVDRLHATAATMSAFLASAVGALHLPAVESERLLSLLNPPGVAYGAGPNKAALIAAAVGSNVLHRRDSDVQVDSWPSGPAYPCVAEVTALGRSVREAGINGTHGVGGEDQDWPIGFVGTSTFGDSPHDRRDLLAASETFLVDLEVLAAPDESPDNLRDELRHYLVVDPATRYTEDFLELDVTGRTGMGSCAMADIFLELPEMPIRATLGSDYLRRNLLRHAGRPIVYHSRKVCHRYDRDRAQQTDLASLVDYAQRDLRHLVLWPVLTRHHRSVRESPDTVLNADGTVDQARYVASLRGARDEALPIGARVPGGFAAVYRAAAQVVADPARAARMRLVAETVDSGPDYAQEVSDGIDDYCFLIEHWRPLIAAAQQQSGALSPMRV